ncbi:hypothetical protein QWJ90_07560 [Microbacterium oryzae]|uniref:hypothetical protein n=1 Tax=Microbacterium oryzae TaxID=743009 RepID=UPI0025AFC679|nr:hypothetical protein [Microbacterium oryzae]MDN3310782.1 hypothetical protein [Microbacterium oryzae]
MTPRRLLILVTAATAVMTLTGCVPEPAPTPSPTGFASEEEAFAAAEATYRAYIDALNARNAGDEDADPERFLTGEPLAADRRTRANLEESGRSIQGDLQVLDFIPQNFSQIESSFEIGALVCIDASAAEIIDEAGATVTPEEARQLYALSVSLTSAGPALKIAASESSSAPC